MLINNVKYKVPFIFLFFIACGSGLHFRDFPNNQKANDVPLLTSQVAYDRNTISTEELHPPLVKEWEEEYISLPNNGFTVVDHWLFFGTHNGYLAAVELNDGDLKGKESFGDACATPPTIYENILFQTFETGSYGLVAYDVSEGDILWRVKNHLSRSSPIVIKNMVIFQTLKGAVICYNYLTGEEIWERSLDTDIRNSPALNANKYITVTLNGTIVAIEFTSGVILWEKKLNLPVFADPVINGNRLYVVSHTGTLHVIELNTGNIIYENNLGVKLYTSPSIDEYSIYIAYSNGKVISLDKSTFRQNWVFSGIGPTAGPPLVSNSYLYFATLAQNLYILDKISGQLIQNIELTGRARSSPIIKEGKLVIACENNLVITYVEEP